jgi:gliding motility-associated-like protein
MQPQPLVCVLDSMKVNASHTVRLLLVVFGFVAGNAADAQVLMSNSTIAVCDTFFRDDGGSGAYTGAELTMTLCPDEAGAFVSLNFLAFSLYQAPNPNNSDYLTIYDGTSTAAASLGSYTGDELQGLMVSSTLGNATGCLTLQFSSPTNNTAGFAGWEATIGCGLPCAGMQGLAEILGQTTLVNNIPTISICQGEEVLFADAGSTIDPGFQLAYWMWDFDDGSEQTLTAPSDVAHTFDDPGAYSVKLVVGYLNDGDTCKSLNINPVQVLVSTPPSFNTSLESPICTGGTQVEGALDGSPVTSILWTDAPSIDAPSISPTGFDAGFTYCSSLELDVFPADAVLETCEDLIQITAEMEHSFLGDLGISITCPNGTTVTLQTQGGGGTFLGEPVDVEDDLTEGVCYAYGWSETSALGQIENPANASNVPYVNALGDNVTGNIVNPGVYQPENTLCTLVGCPLNGTWDFCFTDYLGADNGFVCTWNLVLNPALFPGAIVIQPEIVDAHWNLDPYIGATGITATVDPSTPYVLDVSATAAGSYPFTFSVTNDFGCAQDTTVVLEVVAPPAVTAGADFYACGDATLQAGVLGLPAPECSDDAGTYTLCYQNGITETFTYCPDEPNAGSTFLSIEFLAGQVEVGWDEVNVFDGPDVTSPLLVQAPYYGNAGQLGGLVFTAGNPTGCITLQVTPDFSVDCVSAGYTPWEWVVSCTNAGGIDWTWTPADLLSGAGGASPVINQLDVPTTFTVTGEWSFLPGCGASDQVVVSPAFDIDAIATDPTCFGNDGSVEVLIVPTGSAGPWTVEVAVGGVLAGTAFVSNPANPVLVDGLSGGSVTVEVSDANCTRVLELNLVEPVIPELMVSSDTTICIDGTAVLMAALEPIQPGTTYQWSTGDAGAQLAVSPGASSVYTVFATYAEGCSTPEASVGVILLSPLNVAFMEPVTTCSGIGVETGVSAASGGLAPYSYAWSPNPGFGNSVSYGEVIPSVTSSYCIEVTDACETPAVTGCVEVIVAESLDASVVGDTLGGCFPLTVEFNLAVPSAEVAAAVWTFGDGTSSTSNGSAVHTYIAAGTFPTSVTLTSFDGCISTTDIPWEVTVAPPPFADFAANPYLTALPETRVEFTNFSEDLIDWTWDFAGLGSSTEWNPVFTFPQSPADYAVTLTVENELGCTDAVTRSIRVTESFMLFVPNTFTPDMDGLNDAWQFSGTDIDPSDFSIHVLDRWGNLMYASTDLEGAWVGDVQGGGYFAPNGTYTYIIETRSLATRERKEITGFVTLIR